ncbi:MarR family winged helix-turn-helix transcriptional regulator [Kocuria rhizophila]|uniref:MarR family winged helix-turn-helix transcriptional regulator n=1 Tax=Kocuria rhizophila TaxID=72000 RepID=UPI000B122FCF|nr:MarR family transcriptional regulator [Kocuria rhizophila]
MTRDTAPPGAGNDDAAAPGPCAAAGSAHAPAAAPGPADGAPSAAARHPVASRMVVHSYRPVLEPLGLTHPQYLVMLALWDRHPSTVKDLGEDLMQDSATLSPLLKRLEARGLVTRERDPGNERALAVTVTLEGVALRERAVQVPEEMMQRLRVTAEQVQRLNEEMHLLIVTAKENAQDGTRA